MTKVLFIEAKRKDTININKKELAKLPKELFIAYSIQYKKLALAIKRELGKRIKGFKQVLGCTKLKTKYPILLIGSGRFHANNLAMQNSSPIYIYTENKIQKLDQKEIQKLKQRKQAAISRFLAEEKIGILVSTKPGQKNNVLADKLKKRIEKKQKKAYIFLSNNISLQELENFDIKIWVNTACPGLAFESNNVVNSDDIMPFL
jgi:diphthamide biosynthesis enzyme Dph1/Dph2-like protein